MLVDRSIQIDPAAGDFDICLIGEPPITRRVPAGSGCVDQQRGEPLYPPVDSDMINGDAAFSQQLLNVPVGQSKAQIPADSHHDHVRRKPKPGETGPWRWYSSKAATHPPTLPAPPSVNATDPLDRPAPRWQRLGGRLPGSHPASLGKKR